MVIVSKAELEILRESGKNLAHILDTVAKEIRSGVSTLRLDERAEALIRESGGLPVFKGYKAYGSKGKFPASLCVSVNDEIVHGIPRADRILKEGDIVGLDIGMRHPAIGGLITDMAITVGVGGISLEAKKLIRATEESLELGIREARVGNHIGDIGHAVETRLKKDDFGVIRELVGHGVGRDLHEDPYIPNFGNIGEGEELKDGMVLALEPMATAGSPKIMIGKDGWTYQTKDGSLAAHFEHSIVITKDGPEILTRSQ
ncbi:MAG: type I methionyl aminopeptidase [Patescibacteria group bacterium]